MVLNYQDSVALAIKYGKPTFTLTFQIVLKVKIVFVLRIDLISIGQVNDTHLGELLKEPSILRIPVYIHVINFRK